MATGFSRRSPKGLTYPMIPGAAGADVTGLVDTLDHYVMEQWAQDSETTSLLTYGYNGGVIASGGTYIRVPPGTVTLTDDTTNYVERDSAGVVSANTSAFHAARTPMAKITTAGGKITTVEDWRLL